MVTEVSVGEVLRCNRDILERFYNIKVLEGPVEVRVDALDQGEVYHNVRGMYMKNIVFKVSLLCLFLFVFFAI